MGWADSYIEKLRAGETVSFRPRGNSMIPHIKSGELVTVFPTPAGSLHGTGEIVLCRVQGRQYLHMISAVRPDQVRISNARGKINGWTTLDQIYGRVVSVQP